MLSVKQGGIKHHFLSLWYDATWTWALISRTMGEHFTHYAIRSYQRRLSILYRYKDAMNENRKQIVLKNRTKYKS